MGNEKDKTGIPEDTDLDSVAEEQEMEQSTDKGPKKARKKVPKKQQEPEPEEDEEYDEDEEDEDDEYEDYDDGRSNLKIILVSVLIAVIIAVIAIVLYQKFKEQPAPPAQVQTETENDTETETELVTEAPEPETAAPTATPKPLPTATPLPVTPQAETDSIIPDDEMETDFTETEDAPLTAGEGTETAHIILLGDSRFREMANVVSGDSVLWECSATGDYNWLTETAYPDVDSRVGAGTKILINVGINDLDMSQAYAQSINAKAKEWKEKGASVYYVSVGPVAAESAVSNQEIADFNTYMFQSLDKDTIPFIDAYNYLVEQGFNTVGDVYDNATNTALYQYLMNLIQ